MHNRTHKGGTIMDFSEVLKELRESNCITQEQLARQIDVSRSTIAGYESKNREPDFDKLLSLSRFFHVSVDYLLTGQRNLEFSTIPAPQPDEHIIDRKVIKIYKNLGFEEKKDALKYLELLEYKSRH